MPIPLIVPAAAFIGAAILADAVSSARHPATHRQSIEACTADIRATWVKENGVIRVYHEISAVNCAQIIVECTAPPERPMPPEYGGHPVRLRLIPEGEAYGVMTGAAGIRGMPTFRTFTPAQMAAMRREEAAQGLRATSVAPPG